MLAALGHQNLAELAVLGGFHLHGRLVGLDLGDDIAGAHAIALAHQPFDELSLLHGGRERRHENFAWHQFREKAQFAVTSVKSSEGSGSGSFCANSAASFTRARTSRSISFSSASLARPSFRIRSRKRSIGSRCSRISCTSSRVRYLAGSDIEWPR